MVWEYGGMGVWEDLAMKLFPSHTPKHPHSHTSFLNSPAHGAQMLAEGIGRIGGAAGQVIGKA